MHGFIDGNDGTVYQTLPWNHRGWHCASGRNGSGNNTHIGVEMCEPACIRYTSGSSFSCSDKAAARESAKRTYEAAVELFAMLCGKFGLNPLADGVVISHREGHERGIASNHGDPEHLWKGLGLSYTMDGFRKAVKEKMAGGSNETSGSGTKAADDDGMTDAECPFLVRVKIPNLNIRKGAGTDAAKTGKFTGIGCFTVIRVKSGKGSEAGWGLLKAYQEKMDGWIALDFCEKV